MPDFRSGGRLLQAVLMSLALLILLNFGMTGCSQEKAPSQDQTIRSADAQGRPNVLLLTLDTVRADYIGCYGMSRVKTPAIDELAAEGLICRFNVAPSQCTNPSHASILTGLYLARHQVYNNETPLTDAAWTMAELLQEAGFATLAAVSARHLNPDHSGFGQGFDRFLSCDPPTMNAGERNQEFLPALQGLTGRPFFAWVHYFDPHGDYEPPSPYDTMYGPQDRYDPVASRKSMESSVAKSKEMVDPDEIVPLYEGEISYLDSEIARVLATLADMGAAENTLVVLVADHGESMAEKEIYFCHAGLYNQVLHVPLIMRLPGKLEAGTEIRSLTSSVDILPTVVDLLGLPGLPGDLSGRNLRPAFTDSEAKLHDHVFAEAVNGVIRGVYDGQFKFIKPYPKDWAMPSKRLYATFDDYWEEQDLLQQDPERALAMETLLDAWVDEATAKALPRVQDHEVDEQTRKALKSLGY